MAKAKSVQGELDTMEGLIQRLASVFNAPDGGLDAVRREIVSLANRMKFEPQSPAREVMAEWLAEQNYRFPTK